MVKLYNPVKIKKHKSTEEKNLEIKQYNWEIIDKMILDIQNV